MAASSSRVLAAVTFRSIVFVSAGLPFACVSSMSIAFARSDQFGSVTGIKYFRSFPQHLHVIATETSRVFVDSNASSSSCFHF